MHEQGNCLMPQIKKAENKQQWNGLMGLSGIKIGSGISHLFFFSGGKLSCLSVSLSSYPHTWPESKFTGHSF